jgi:hypothetical protein
MTNDEWAQLTDVQKFDWLYDETVRQADFAARIADRVRQNHQAFSLQIDAANNQIGGLTADVHDLKEALDGLRGHKE